MPRYIFHTCGQDGLIWDTTVLDVPEVTTPDDELTSALWSEVFDQQIQRSRTFVITDDNGRVVFATCC